MERNFETFFYKGKTVIIKPGNSFSKNELISRLNEINLQNIIVSLDKKSLIDLYEKAITNDNNKIKIFEKLDKDTNLMNIINENRKNIRNNNRYENEKNNSNIISNKTERIQNYNKSFFNFYTPQQQLINENNRIAFNAKSYKPLMNTNNYFYGEKEDVDDYENSKENNEIISHLRKNNTNDSTIKETESNNNNVEKEKNNKNIASKNKNFLFIDKKFVYKIIVYLILSICLGIIKKIIIEKHPLLKRLLSYFGGIINISTYQVILCLILFFFVNYIFKFVYDFVVAFSFIYLFMNLIGRLM